MSSVPNSPLPDDILSAPPGSTAAHDRLLFVGFDDWQIAHQRLCWIAGTGEEERLFRKCLPALLQVLCDSAAPDQVLMYLERLASAVPDRAEFFRMFLERPRGWEILGRLFAGSQFLSEILLSNPAYLDPLTRQRTLSEIKGVEQFHQEARSSLAECATEAERWDALRRHQRWELLRIGVCDFFGLLDLRRVTVQLSLLADGLIASALDLAANTPGADGQCPDPTRPALERSGFVVVALGKLGGEELNYSSDIDLLFLSSAGHPDHTRIGQRLIKILTSATGHGFLYRVDMRLRPWGRAGELVPTLGAYVEYLEQQARIWEKQALLKARVVAGDRAAGATFLRQVGERIFGESPADVRDEIRRMKERIEGDLRKQGKDWGEIKLGRGSIRDVEFAAQSLQLVHGGRLPDARSFNTLDALVRLTDLGFLQADEYRMLSDAYVFLRTVEHALQLRHNKQTHELPRDPAELMSLARRLDFGSDTQFLDHYRRHRDATRRVFDRCLGNSEPQRPELEPPLAMPRGPARTTAETPGRGSRSARTQRHLSRLAATYEQAFPPADIDRHAALAESLSPDVSVLVEAKPRGDGAWTLTIVGYDFHGALSLIAGLLLAHGCNVIDGQVFTYDPAAEGDVVSAPPLPPRDVRPAPSEQRSMHVRKQSRRETPHVEGETRVDRGRRIVDVFTVRPTFAEAGPENWKRYEEELRALSDLAAQGRVDEAHGRLVKRVAATLRAAPVPAQSTLYPIEIAIDNELSDRFTVLIIRGRDTLGFLYELTSALAQAGVSINRLQVGYALGDACDTIHVTDRQGRKIVDTDRRRELQATTVLIKHFTHLLPQSPDPEGALVRFRDFLARLFQRPNWPDEVADLERPEVLRALARLLGVSDFLWNDFLRMQHENLFPLVRDVDALATRKSPIQLEAELRDWLAAAGPQWRGALSDYRDREMFRVDMRQILGHTEDFVRFSEELTDVADATVRAALGRCHAELVEQFGRPVLAEGGPCRLAVCALGKCGGREMGFASDIELMFLFEGRGKTDREPIRNEQFCVKLVDAFLHTLKSRREGVFEIDLRLRPHGRAGSLAVSLAAFREYFAPHGAAWPFERQALVKLRPVWGDASFGEEIVRSRDELIYSGEAFDTVAMRGMRERQLRQLVAPGRFNAKLGPGGLVDIEYLVQGLQISHAAADPGLRSTNTLEALAALGRAGVVPPGDADDLRDAFLYLRGLIGAMRMVRGNARELSVPDPQSEECAFLCRRLGHDDPARLHADLARHTGRVREINQRLLP